MDQDLDRILGDEYLAGLAGRTVAELRSSRAECQALETKLSFLRRMVQGRHDIVTGEIDRRSHGGDPDDVHDLVDRLPEILADRTHAPGPGRMVATMEPGELSGRLVDRLADITSQVPLESPGSASDADLVAVAADLSVLEHDVSGYRRALFDRIDALQAEITHRYRDGTARVDDLLAGDT